MEPFEAVVVAALAEQAGDVFDERAVVEKIRFDGVFDEIVVLVSYGIAGIHKYRCTFSEAERLDANYGELTGAVDFVDDLNTAPTVQPAESAGDTISSADMEQPPTAE